VAIFPNKKATVARYGVLCRKPAAPAIASHGGFTVIIIAKQLSLCQQKLGLEIH
jgi:hypothetical protein